MRAISKFLTAGAAVAALSFAAAPANALVYIGVQQAGVNGGNITTLNPGGSPIGAVFGGSYGDWEFTLIMGNEGLGNPILLESSASTHNLTTENPRALNVYVTVTDLTKPFHVVRSAFTSNIAPPTGWTLTGTTWFDDNNGIFTGTQLASGTFNGLGLSEEFDAISPNGTYSLTAQYTIDGPGMGNSSVGSIGIDGVAVPEPATWALMIMGFGSAGAMLRSRRRTASVAA